ncbi:MAG: acetate kinase [Candidatus Binatia bacterium]|nr:MAG: acetate kinase [Candidatus Binatia bacterium]
MLGSDTQIGEFSFPTQCMPTRILVLNAGSSSLKFAVYNCEEELAAECEGNVQGVGGQSRARLVDRGRGQEVQYDLDTLDYEHALLWVLDWYEREFAGEPPAAVGHRIVHGGSRFSGPVVITAEVRRALGELSCWAPLHQPRCLEGVDLAARAWPHTLQVGSFDTAFHANQPRVARLFALPRAWVEAGVLRYGFHGLSFASVVRQLTALAPEQATGKCIVAHLGSGASLCAIAGGSSVATTMGLTPLDGVPMGSRPGSVDPGALLYLLRHGGMDLDELEHTLYHESGMKGLSGLTSDFRLLEASSLPAAREALELFVYRVQREVASLAGALRGLDVLVFTGGVGEHSATMRERICRGLEWLGVELDPEANRAGSGRISHARSSVATWVIPSDENGQIAREVYDQLCFRRRNQY